MSTKDHPGFLSINSYDYRYVEMSFGCELYSDFKNTAIRNGYHIESLPLDRPNCNFDMYQNDSGFYIPIQLKNCKNLYISKLSSYFGCLLSTKGLPLKVFELVKISNQSYLDLNELDYSGVKQLNVIDCNFKNLDFIKKWNVRHLELHNMNFSSIEQLNDDLEILKISSICGPLDFTHISNLQSLVYLNFCNFSSTIFSEHPEWFINIIDILNISNDINIISSIDSNSPFDDTYHRGIICYMTMPYDKRKEYIMDCLVELLDNGFINAGG